MVAASTLLVLATFVTPLATGFRTAAAFGTGAGGQAWLLSAMSVGLAAALLVAGAAADQLGRRRVFVGGLVLLGVGAALSAVAGSTARLPGRPAAGGAGRRRRAGVLARPDLRCLPRRPAACPRGRRLGCQRGCRYRDRRPADRPPRHRRRLAGDVRADRGARRRPGRCRAGRAPRPRHPHPAARGPRRPGPAGGRPEQRAGGAGRHAVGVRYRRRRRVPRGRCGARRRVRGHRAAAGRATGRPLAVPGARASSARPSVRW